MTVLNRLYAMITQKEEIEFATKLFHMLNLLIDLIIEKYGAAFFESEEEECPFEEIDDPFEDEILF